MLKDGARTGRIVSIDRVRAELVAGGDALADWVKRECVDGFESTNRVDVIDFYGKLIKWAQGEPQYQQQAKANFAGTADAWIVAYALAGGHTVVTHETLNLDSAKSIKIPNACHKFGVRWLDPFKMLREIGWKLR